MTADITRRFTGRRLAPLTVCTLVTLLGLSGARAGDAPAVVELFTSQGCSSCPPADSLMAKLAADPDVVALTFPVDYWDYLGWQDTFARDDFSKRQKGYARARGDNEVYTPQAVVNGVSAVIGSDEAKVRDAIDTLRKTGQVPSIPISARIEGDKVVVEVPEGAAPHNGRASLWIAAYRKPTTVKVEKGENTGRTLTYTNVVERWQVLGIWDGSALRVDLPLADIAQDDTAGCAIILQSKKDHVPGRIIGATRIDLHMN